jgi:hypothetical protein
MDSLRVLHDPAVAASPIDIRPTTTTSPCMTRKNVVSFSEEVEQRETFQGRKSAKTYPGRDSFEWQRHTFSALPSGMCEFSQRSSDELNDLGSQSLPPRLSPSPRSGSHTQHLRVYGRSCDTNNQTHEEDQAGEMFVEIVSPTHSTIWTRGKPALIEWQILDVDVDTVQIDLLEQGSNATTVIVKDALNNGEFSYPKVPWGMACGDKYFLRVSSTSDPSRYITTGFFSIGSAP